MNYRRLSGLVLLFCISFSGFAQDKIAWVMLSDKDGSLLDPFAFFDPKAIERRVRNDLPLVSYSDLPVRQDYVHELSKWSDSIVYVSRWMNAVILVTDQQRLASIHSLPFVKEIWLPEDGHTGSVARHDVRDRTPDDAYELTSDMLALARAQTARMNGAEFKASQVDGREVRIAIFDIGFSSYKTHPAFKHIVESGRVRQTWDFTRKKENVDGYHDHGAMVLSCIAGLYKDTLSMGLATGSEFLLAITERKSERFREEVNWLAAAEWADQHGADIINSSLGYTYHRYFRYEMDGKTSFVSRAAKMASDKGILVVNSAGNDGFSEWKNIAAPADVEEVLTVGGISPGSGFHVCFSSFGPTSDKRLKPNVSAYGEVASAGSDGFNESAGTSFASPLVAGFAACVLQMHPDWDRQRAFEEIQRSGDLYPYYDYVHGYGVPDARYFTQTRNDTTTDSSYFRIKDHKQYLEIILRDTVTDSLSKAYRRERVLQGDDPDTEYYIKEPGYIYYHIENKRDYLDAYKVIVAGNEVVASCTAIERKDPFSALKIYKSDYAMPFTLRVYYRGQVRIYQCKE